MDDRNRYLRATAFYWDRQGPGKSAQYVSSLIQEILAVPETPSVPSVSAGVGNLSVSWTAPLAYPAITGYVVRHREPGSVEPWIEAEVSANVLRHTISGLAPGTAYGVKLRAENDQGPSGWSASTEGTPRAGGGGGSLPVPQSNDCPGDIGTLAATATRNGSWASDCESSVSGRGYARYYSFSIAAEARVTIDLVSSVNTYLYFRDGSATAGATLHENDDVDSGNTNSRIVATLPDGNYTVEATTNPAGATGSFTLTVTTEEILDVIVAHAAVSENAQVRPGSPISLTATFSRPVSGFIVEDITVVNGVADNFAGSGAVYTFEVTPNAIGEVTVDIAAGVAEGADGSGNTASPFSLGITYDDDGDGGFSRAEAILAIRDYFDGGINRAQAIAVIQLYFA